MPEETPVPRIPRQVDSRLLVTAAGLGICLGIVIGMKLAKSVEPAPQAPMVVKGPCQDCEDRAVEERRSARHLVNEARPHEAPRPPNADVMTVAPGDSSLP